MNSYQELEEIEQKLNEYQQNLSEVQSILEREKEKTVNNLNTSNTNRINDLMKLQKDLLNAIVYQEDLRNFKIQISSDILNDMPLNQSHIGKICSGLYVTENDKQWFTAMINEVNEIDQTSEITWLGYKEKISLPWSYIKLQEAIKPEDLEIGMMCEGIYYEDGKWYPAEIVNISEHGVHIKFKQYDQTEVTSFDSIRITPEQKLQNRRKKEIGQTKKNVEEVEFKLPEYLKVTPADNEAERLSKRKRVKSLKNKHKQKIIEKISKEKQDTWLTFNQKINKTKALGTIIPMKKF